MGPIPGDGVLVDLSATLPAYTPALLQATSTALLVWWMLLRRSADVPWTRLLRPLPAAPTGAA